MNPEQVQGLWLCFTISISTALICPAVLWVLPSRTVA